MIQELTVRLGIVTGRGYGELIRERFGAPWAWAALLGLGAAVMGSLVTEFTGVAGIGELYGLSRALTLPLAAAALLAIVGSGSYKRMERAAIGVGLFELAFFVVAWASHPSLAALARDAVDQPLENPNFLYMAAAIIGAVFNPWMLFYQQSAIAEKKLGLADLKAARLDTGFRGRVDAMPDRRRADRRRHDLGPQRRRGSRQRRRDQRRVVAGARRDFWPICVQRRRIGRVAGGGHCLFAGARLGRRRSLGLPSFAGTSTVRGEILLCGIYAVCVVGSAALVGYEPNLVGLNIAAQVLNALLLPLVIGMLIALAVTALPETMRPRGTYLWILIALSACVIAVGVFGAVQGLLGS